MSGELVDVRMARHRVEQLARWWNAATQEARWKTFEAAVKGDREAPSLRLLQIAIYLAETEAGEVSER